MKESAGILIRDRRGFLLVHPGGPFYVSDRIKCWSIPKGEYDKNTKVSPLKDAVRELREETGIQLTGEDFIDLGTCSSNHKNLRAWLVVIDIPKDHVFRSNTFKLGEPKGSGCYREYPEVDRFEFFDYDDALRVLSWYQVPLLERARKILGEDD